MKEREGMQSPENHMRFQWLVNNKISMWRCMNVLCFIEIHHSLYGNIFHTSKFGCVFKLFYVFFFKCHYRSFSTDQQWKKSVSLFVNEIMEFSDNCGVCSKVTH